MPDITMTKMIHLKSYSLFLPISKKINLPLIIKWLKPLCTFLNLIHEEDELFLTTIKYGFFFE